MAIGPEGIQGPAQIEFRFHRDGKPLELDGLIDRTFRIERFRGLVQATVAFGFWLQDIPAFTDRGWLLARRHLEDLRLLESGLRHHDVAAVALHLMATEIASGADEDWPYVPRLRFDFVGAYRLNPTGFRFQVHGAPYALLILAGICGCTAAYKEMNAVTCEELVHAAEREQIAGLERMHRREGRWTASLAESHERVVQSSRLATRECHVLFPDVDIDISLTPRPHFEVRIKQRPENPTQHPVPGR
ncbi:hypothetical protein [Methylobacterium pseudosasicola]|uniref:Uncharacterized protein n=1 Tax=Methylobacterium pseudosasicola TaxID=582667 RepID=A0A1I4PY94_9HYPH|nr:hypothetical protein [Methylobacterium pseudosasicola]SFM32586.1 hypothetical protein SAMN05192568_102717 [Methylobacterium pseudosasicola]